MTERRIILDPKPAHNDMQRLKNVAGLVQNLSYREMKFLSTKLYDATEGVEDPRDMPSAILETVDEIMATSELPK